MRESVRRAGIAAVCVAANAAWFLGDVPVVRSEPQREQSTQNIQLLVDVGTYAAPAFTCTREYGTPAVIAPEIFDDGIAQAVTSFMAVNSFVTKQCGSLEARVSKKTACSVYRELQGVFPVELRTAQWRSAAKLLEYARKTQEREAIEIIVFSADLFFADRLVSQRDSPLVVAGQVFRELTGQQIPEGLTIVRENIDDTRLDGYHDASRAKVGYRPTLGWAQTVLILLHELGHVIALPLETYGDQRKDPRVLEEACAYAFTQAGIDYLRSTKQYGSVSNSLQILFERELLLYGKEYCLGRDDPWFHGYAACVFRATHSVLGTGTTAFKYLQTVPEASLRNVQSAIRDQLRRDQEVLSLDRSIMHNAAILVSATHDAYLSVARACSVYGVTLEGSDAHEIQTKVPLPRALPRKD